MTSIGGGAPGGGVGEVYRQQILVEWGGQANVVQHGDQHIYQGPPAYQIEAFPLTVPAPDPAWLLEQPSRLLDARSQVVDFTGRAQELQDLLEWRDAPRAALSVRLLHGPGGQGKTRLATQFAQLSGRADWTVLQARRCRLAAGQPEGPRWLGRACAGRWRNHGLPTCETPASLDYHRMAESPRPPRRPR